MHVAGNEGEEMGPGAKLNGMNLSLRVWERQDWRRGSEMNGRPFLEGLGRGEAVRSTVLGTFSGEK